METLKKIVNAIEEFLYNIFVVFSKGFFFYLSLLVGLLHKVFPLSIFEKTRQYFIKKQDDATAFLLIVIIFLVGVNLYIRFYEVNDYKAHVSQNTINNKVVESNNSSLDETELNLYKRYGKLDINSVSIEDLKKTNDQVVAWITVDGTGINYPIVKGNDNSFYLNHDINKNVKLSGWTFMDYRNSADLSDDNTVFYGHNLANKTAFGSLTNVFTKEWFEESNHYIVALTEKGKYVYEIFSVYSIEPEVYYLQNNFDNDEDLYKFITALQDRSMFKFNTKLNKEDKIITLSTCSSDNKKRNVVHAKLIKK